MNDSDTRMERLLRTIRPSFRIEVQLTMSMQHYDLCVIGGGPAGYAAAMRAIDMGKRTIMVERDRIGGTGIYNGALSSKTLWELSQKVNKTNDIIRTRGREPFRLSWNEIQRTLDEAIFERKYLYKCHMSLLKNDPHGTFTHARGTGHFIDPHTLRIRTEKLDTFVTADHFIVATGSRPRKLDHIPVDEQIVLTSDGMSGLTDLPKSLVIIGAGVIGCEFATIFSNFGETRVHLIDRADRILPFEDEDISNLIAKGLERKGVVIHHNATLKSLTKSANGVKYELTYPDGTSELVEVEKALLSVGRVANVEGLGLEEAGVQRDAKSGRLILTDTRTTATHIHAVGDVTSSHMLVNLGELEGRHAVELIYKKTAQQLSYDNVSSIMFLNPEVAGVGMNEQQCREQGIPHRVAKLDYACLARAIAMRRTKGFFKVIVTDDDNMRILGMRAVGEHASSAIQGVAMMIRAGTSVRELTQMIYPHPSITEGILECARMFMNESLFKSEVFGDKMQCYTWKNERIGSTKAA